MISAAGGIKSAIRSAIMIVGMLVLAQGIDGISDASQTLNPSTPCTRPVDDATAMGSSADPMRHVPDGCHVPPTWRRTNSVSAASSSSSPRMVVPSVIAECTNAGRSGPATSRRPEKRPRCNAFHVPGTATFATRGE